MTIGEQMEFDKKLGRKATQAEYRTEELRQKKEIKKYCNFHGYSDVDPFEVVRVISEQTVEIRKMKTEQIKFPTEYHAGGFGGHYADNYGGQDYKYISDESYPIERIRWSKANGKWQQGKYSTFYMSDQPYKHYDYNF